MHFCNCVLNFLLLRVVHVNRCGVVMASCATCYRPFSVVKQIVRIVICSLSACIYKIVY